MWDFFTLITTTYASSTDIFLNTSDAVWIKWIISVICFVVLFTLLISEKIDKTLVSILTAWILIFFQVFTWVWDWWASSQEIATFFIYHNLDIFGFIIWMMLLTGIAHDSWIFNYIWLLIAKKINGNPTKLFFIFSFIAFVMTVFISNIPTIIILAPIVILISTKLDLPSFPYVIWIITFANLGWAVTPISDPTTYYQAATLWFWFLEVISNTWLIMLTVTISSSIYLYLVFRKDFAIKPEMSYVRKLKPKKHLKSKKRIIISVSTLLITIFLVVGKEFISAKTSIRFDNWSITLFMAFLTIMILKYDVSAVLKSKIDYSTLFFFAWIFIVVWSLEQNWIIILIADKLVQITWWGESALLFIFTMWSSLLSVFIDNVPYNIAMVSTLQSFADSGVVTWASWTALARGLNSCTSIWWAGSPIWAACNVIALWEAEKKWVLIWFTNYLKVWIPLVILNSFIAFLILYFRYLV